MIALDVIQAPQESIAYQLRVGKFAPKQGARILNQVSFDHVAKLAHISGPGVLLEISHCGGMHAFDVSAHTLAEILQDVPDERGNVLAPFP